MGANQSATAPPALASLRDPIPRKRKRWNPNTMERSWNSKSRRSPIAIKNVAFRFPILLLTAMLLQSYFVTATTAQSDWNFTVPRKSNSFVPVVPESYQSELVSLSIRGIRFRLPKAYLYSYGPEYYDLKDGDDAKEFSFRLKWPQMTPIVTNGKDPDIRPYSGNVIVIRYLRFDHLEQRQPAAVSIAQIKAFNNSLGPDEEQHKEIFERKTQLKLVGRLSSSSGPYRATIQADGALRSSLRLTFYQQEAETLESISRLAPRIGLLSGWVEAEDGAYGYELVNEGSFVTDWTDRALYIDNLIRGWRSAQ